MSKPTHLDLFSGIGGFALAAQAAGFQTIAFSEVEPYACRVLARHWPDVPNLGDIRAIRGVTADLVTGGFPCQPFSVAGKRGGASDDRALWPEMLRVIADVRPAWVLGENVPGLIGMELDNCLSDLEAIDYACWPVVIPAVAVDARHRRDRVWIVGHAVNLRESQPEGGEPDERRWVGNSSEAVANHACSRQGHVRERQTRREFNRRGTTDGGCRWNPEPAVGRVAHGIPNRSHRLKGLGNAIVPQVAEVILRAIAQQMEAAA